MRWRSLVWLAVGMLALAHEPQAQQDADAVEPAPAGRPETPTQAQTPLSGGSAATGQVYGIASFPRDSSGIEAGVNIAVPALGPGLEVEPPVIDPSDVLSLERISPRRWMTVSANREFKAAGYKSFVGSVYRGCEQLCLREPGCVAIEFRHSDNRCQLFDRREDSAAAPKSDIGFVRQQASR